MRAAFFFVVFVDKFCGLAALHKTNVLFDMQSFFIGTVCMQCAGIFLWAFSYSRTFQ